MASDPYFGAPAGVPTEPGRYVDVADLPVVEPTPGLEIRPLTGTNMMVTFVRYLPHVVAPRHAHVEEQVFVALEGEFEVDIGGDVRTVSAGQAAVIPSWVPHQVTAGADGAYQLDVFCPPREGIFHLLAALER